MKEEEEDPPNINNRWNWPDKERQGRRFLESNTPTHVIPFCTTTFDDEDYRTGGLPWKAKSGANQTPSSSRRRGGADPLLNPLLEDGISTPSSGGGDPQQ